jgi:hypothetical protein
MIPLHGRRSAPGSGAKMDIIVNWDRTVTPSNFTNYAAAGFANGAAEEAAFQNAVTYVVNYYNAIFTNHVTVTIDVGVGKVNGKSIAAGALGETFQNQIPFDTVGHDYSKVQSKLSDLPPSNPFTATLYLTTAYQRALGLLPPTGGTQSNPDASIVLSDTEPFSYSITATPSNGQYYFIGTVEHEISEAMGRISFASGTGNGQLPGPAYTIMDLFRYSGHGTLQTTTGSPAYFSLDDGLTPIDYWNNITVDPTGDLGDWAANGPGGLDDHPTGSDAYLDQSPSNQINALTQTDLQLMRAIGWKVNTVFSWKQAINGDFDAAAFWSSGVVPTPLIDAHIIATGAYTITSSADETINSLATAKGVTLAINSDTFMGPAISSWSTRRSSTRPGPTTHS